MKLNKNVFFIINSLIITLTIYFVGCISSQETATGKLAFQQEQYERAEEQLTKGLETDKDDQEAWYMLGFSRIELGKYEKATMAFEKARGEFGDKILRYWGLKFNLAINAYNDGVKSKAKGDPFDVYSRSLHTAVNDFHAAACIIPDSIISVQLMGETFALLGISDSAMYAFNNVIDKPKSSVDAESMAKSLYHIGLDYIQDEDYTAAYNINSSILKINGLLKTSKYYEVGLLNSGLCKYFMGVTVFTSKTLLDSLNGMLKTETDTKKLEKINKRISNINEISSNGDMKKYFKESLDYLEPLANVSKDKKVLNDTYDILITIYDTLGDTAKRDETSNKKLELNK